MFYRTSQGTKTSLVPGQMYLVRPGNGFIPKRKYTHYIFRYLGEEYRRRLARRSFGYYVRKGRCKWFLNTMPVISDGRPFSLSCIADIGTTYPGMGLIRYKIKRFCTVDPIDVKDLPMYLWLPNKYPELERALNS